MSLSGFRRHIGLKPLVLLLLLLPFPGAAGEKPKVADCFKIQSLVKADDAHYWAKWTNTCPYAIDSVYVLVGFSDKFHKALGNGVWGLHFLVQGLERVTRFSTPAGIADFEFLNVRKITTDAEEALH